MVLLNWRHKAMDFETYEKNQTPPIDWEYHYEPNNEKGGNKICVYQSKN